MSFPRPEINQATLHGMVETRPLPPLLLQASIFECPSPLSDTPTRLQKHTHLHYTQPICSPVVLQIVFSAKSNWRLSKALLSIFPVFFCFIVLSRYFPWWLACCRWKRENCVWIMNSHLPPFFSLPNTLEAPAVVYPWSLTSLIINRLKDDV